MIGRPGLRDLTLGELNAPSLARMVAEGESLFVEHKADIAKGEGFQLAKAAASFANTMGGWILVGVSQGSVDPNWSPPVGDFVDAVRQRLEGQIDPLPSFAAALDEHDGLRLGVVRIYESADTPHILRDGSIVVREPAQDAKLRKRGQYEATPIRSHYELLQLAQRGERARTDAERRFQERARPLIDHELDLRYTTAASQRATYRTLHPRQPAVVLRLAPLTLTRRWRDWAVSASTVERISTLALALAGPNASPAQVSPHPSGFAATSVDPSTTPWTPGANIAISKSATVAVDAGGVIGARVAFSLHEVGGRVHCARRIDDGSLLEDHLWPLLEATTEALAFSEHLGRYGAHVLWLKLADLYRRDPNDPDGPRPPGAVPTGGEISISGPPTLDDQLRELQGVGHRWVGEFSRASGIETWLTD